MTEREFRYNRAGRPTDRAGLVIVFGEEYIAQSERALKFAAEDRPEQKEFWTPIMLDRGSYHALPTIEDTATIGYVPINSES